MSVRVTPFCFSLLFSLLLAPQTRMTSYQDPGKMFRLRLPPDWTAQRTLEKVGWFTLLSWGNQPAKVAILVAPVPHITGRPPELQETLLREISRPHFDGWLASLKAQARVEVTRKVYKVQFGGANALRMDVLYYRGDNNDPRRGYAVFFFGQRTAFFIAVSGSEQGFREAGQIASTFQSEPGS